MNARLMTENTARSRTVPALLQPAHAAVSRAPDAKPRLLVPVDGSPASKLALDYVIGMARKRPLTVHLLNVQPAVMSGDVSVLTTARSVEERRRATGERTLARARRMLAASHVEHVAEVVLGSPAEAIVRSAADNDCSKIVLSDADSGFLDRILRRRVVNRVVRLARIPVTVVPSTPERKAGPRWAASPAG